MRTVRVLESRVPAPSGGGREFMQPWSHLLEHFCISLVEDLGETRKSCHIILRRLSTRLATSAAVIFSLFSTLIDTGSCKAMWSGATRTLFPKSMPVVRHAACRHETK